MFKRKTLKYDMFSPEGQLVHYGYSLNNFNKEKAQFCVRIDKVTLSSEKVNVLIWKNSKESKRKEGRLAKMSILNLAEGMKNTQFYVVNPCVYKEEILGKLKPSGSYLDNMQYL